MSDDITRVKNILAKYVPLVADLQKKVKALEAEVDVLKKSHSVDTLLGQRFIASSQENRGIRADPKRIAYAGYLIYQKGASLKAVSESGILSYSQLIGLNGWAEQHREDYMTIQGLQGVFYNGLPAEEIKEFGEEIDLEPIKHYLPITAKEHENEQRVL